nr:MAG TPA: Junctional sarcoplasmic reticulum protein [Caudoviricetes sp.]
MPAIVSVFFCLAQETLRDFILKRLNKCLFLGCFSSLLSPPF